MQATDGDIGNVKEFYFDDTKWSVRYLIVQTGNWLSGREVLIAPQAIIETFGIGKKFLVNFNKEKVCNSPDIDTHKPVSGQQEIELYGHYAWQRYGGSGFYAGGSIGFITPHPTIDEKILTEIIDKDKRVDYDVHLRSTSIITGYHIKALDGEIGHVNDFIINDETWQVIYLVIDTHNWVGGKKILIPVTHIKDIQWENSKVVIDETITTIKDSIVFDESKFIEQ